MKFSNFNYFFANWSLIIQNSSFAKLAPPKSIWKQIVDVGMSKLKLIISTVQRNVTLITKSNQVGKTIIMPININVVSNEFFMRSTTLTSSTISFKNDFFINVESSGIWFLNNFSTFIAQFKSWINSIKCTFTSNTLYYTWLYRHNLDYSIVQSISKGEC